MAGCSRASSQGFLETYDVCVAVVLLYSRIRKPSGSEGCKGAYVVIVVRIGAAATVVVPVMRVFVVVSTLLRFNSQSVESMVEHVDA